MRVRVFNQAGIEAFRKLLEECRVNPGKLNRMAFLPRQLELLEDDSLTTFLRPACNTSKVSFSTKGEAADYLHKLLKEIDDSQIETNAGLWSWLSLFHFDQVCPESGGKRGVKNDYYYIFEPHYSRHAYRHLLYISWQILRIAPNFNRLMLSTPVSSLDGITTEIMKRLYLTRIPCIFELLEKLYWVESSQSPRRGITTNSPKRGDLRNRLPVRIQQLQKTYDLYSISADQLIELLGDEFKTAPSKSSVPAQVPSVARNIGNKDSETSSNGARPVSSLQEKSQPSVPQEPRATKESPTVEIPGVKVFTEDDRIDFIFGNAGRVAFYEPSRGKAVVGGRLLTVDDLDEVKEIIIDALANEGADELVVELLRREGILPPTQKNKREPMRRSQPKSSTQECEEIVVEMTPEAAQYGITLGIASETIAGRVRVKVVFLKDDGRVASFEPRSNLLESGLMRIHVESFSEGLERVVEMLRYEDAKNDG